MENISMKIMRFIKVNGKKAKRMVKEYIDGKMENNMMENGKMIWCMDKVLFYGQMEISIKDNLN